MKTPSPDLHNPVSATIRLLWTWTTPIVIFILLVLAMFPARAKANPASNDFSAVDAYIEAQKKSLHIPGIAVAIIQGDQITYMRGYGDSGRGKQSVTPQTPFMIGSVTKSFTALAIMQLVEAGKIQLDAPVQTYLPWFRVADPVASAQITVRHLLNQNSGLSTGSGLTEEMVSDLSDTAIEDGVRRLADDVLTKTPGTTFQYSNVNFNILGQIIQTITGQSYESYIQEFIFDPLDMQHSFTSQDEAIKDGMARGHTIYLGMRLPKDIPFNRGGLPNGSIISSAEDMAHFLIAQLNDGRYGTASVLSPQGVDAMHQPDVPMGTSDEFYGMAWHVGEIEDLPAFSHSGDNPNYTTYVAILPAQKLGVVILQNAQGFFMVNSARQTGNGVLAILLGKQPQPYVFPKEGLVLQIGSIMVPVIVSVLWMGWMLFRFLRRQRRGAPVRRSFWWYLWVVVLPLIIDLGLIWVLLIGIPTLWQIPMNVIATFLGELFSLLVVTAAALLGWGTARTILTLRPAKAAVQNTH